MQHDISSEFQSTHPSGVRRGVRRTGWRRCRYFNPRTPVGCDGHKKPPVRVVGISIHAPQWGATVLVRAPRGVERISIHAPQWGATRASPTLWTASRHFNPRTPVGCDRRPRAKSFLPPISIHAPQWGATFQIIRAAECFTYFNPRTPVGCDRPTPPCPSRVSYFNPRTPVGCDRRCGHEWCKHRSISIHAPQWGATSDMLEI